MDHLPIEKSSLTSPWIGGSIPFVSMEGVDEMKGGVYSHRKGFRVYFRGEWFTKDEHGRPFKAEFYAHSFLNLLNALYDPDPAKNRYDPKKFKDRTPYRFDQAFALYLDHKQNDSSWHSAKKRTWKKYFMPYFTNQDFRTIDDVQLQAFLGYLEGRGLKGKTIKNIFTILFGFLNHFKRSINIFPQSPDMSYQQPRIRRFTEKEIDQVFEFIQEEDKGYFLSIRYYGMRPEEASGLLRPAINWEIKEIIISTVFVDGQIKTRTKTKKERTLPIIPEMEPYLKPIGGSIFIFHIDGHPYTRHMRENRWNRAMEQANQKYGTRRMTLRDLRNSAASQWVKRGMLIQDVAQLLGNSPEVVRKHYTDQMQDNVVSIVRGK